METTNEKETRCGYVTLIGRPNVGKSTLINKIVGEKVAIVTPKPQTTRNRILAVHNEGEAQIIFWDTPGLHTPRGPLGRFMVEEASSALSDSDIIAWMIDTDYPKREKDGLTSAESEIATQMGETSKPILVLLNKIDRVKDKSRLLALMADLAAKLNAEEIIPISALKGEGVALFLDQVVKRLPMGPKLYPEDMLSEQAERFFVAEIIREVLMDLTHQEIPYHSAVVIDKYIEETRRCVIHGTIHVERQSQKKIVVGQQGSLIKEIGQRARQAAEDFLACPVELRLHVDVSPGWTRSENKLKKMGYK